MEWGSPLKNCMSCGRTYFAKCLNNSSGFAWDITKKKKICSILRICAWFPFNDTYIHTYLVSYKSRWVGPAMWVQDISCKPDNLGSIWYVVFPLYFLVSEYLGTILYIFWCTNITHLLITCQWNYKKLQFMSRRPPS